MKRVNTKIPKYLSNLFFCQLLYIICRFYSLTALPTKGNYICANMKAALMSRNVWSQYIVEKPVGWSFTPTLQNSYVIGAIHRKMNHQEETPKLKIWAMSDMSQSRKNTKWESINVLPLRQHVSVRAHDQISPDAFVPKWAWRSVNPTQFDAQPLV